MFFINLYIYVPLLECSTKIPEKAKEWKNYFEQIYLILSFYLILYHNILQSCFIQLSIKIDLT